MQKKLIISPSWLGDIIMSQSLIKTIRALDHECIIDVVAPLWSGSIFKYFEDVNFVWQTDISHGELKFQERYKLAQKIKTNNYDQVFVLPNSFKSALIPFWTKIPKRTGWFGEHRWFLLNDVRKLDKKKYPRMIERYVALAYPKNASLPLNILYPELKVDPKLLSITKNKLNLLIDHPNILALCPGAAYGDAKCWLQEYFAEVANYYLDHMFQVWIVGSNNEKNIASFIQVSTNNRCIDMTGKTDLIDVVNVLSYAKIILANDSGLMHVGAALDKPIVGIYGPTDKHFCPPLTKHARSISLNLPCQPCRKRVCPLKHHLCMKNITPQQVIKNINELIDEKNSYC